MTDNNNLEDLEHNELGGEAEEFAQGTGMRANLAHAWRTQPLIKLFALMVVAAAVVSIGVNLFSSPPDARKNTTSLGSVPNLHEAPGGKASEYVRQETRLANEQREKEALSKGESSMPTPIGSDTETKKDDPLNELRAEIENLTKEVNRPKPQPQPAPPVVQQQAVQQPEQFDEGLAKAMQKQMGELMKGWQAHGVKTVAVSLGTAGGGEVPVGAPAAATNVADSRSGVDSGEGAQAPKILIPAGTISYAKLLTEANSDVPGPILAEIVSGPLTGARAIGKFTTENAYTDYLVLRFTLAELHGKEYQINTLAIDPDTSLGGMATDVDERYFERVFLPAAASFVSSLGQTLSQNNSSITSTGTTTIVTQGKQGIREGLYAGIGSAADSVSQFVKNQANQTKPLVVVAAGTPMGLMFVTSVKDAPAVSLTSQRGTQQGRGGMPINQGLAGYSASDASLSVEGGAYPGATVQGYGNGLPTSGPYQSTSPSPFSSLFNASSRYSPLLPGYTGR